MSLRVGIIGSNSSASVVPGWNDYEFQQWERIFLTEGIIEGIGGAFAVTQRAAGPNLRVDIASGRALIEITNTNLAHGKTYKVYFDSDATENRTVAAADPTNPRKDRVILRVSVAANPDGASSNVGTIEVLTGTPAGSPSPPAEPANAITLALIDVPAGDTSIENAQITDQRTYADIADGVLQNIARADILAGTGANQGASLIGVRDQAGLFTGTTVETVLQEIFENGGAKNIGLVPDTGNPASEFGCSAVENYLPATSIAFDANTTGTTGSASSHNIAHTCSGSNRLLLIAFAVRSGSDLVTGVTYNGVAATQVQALINAPTSPAMSLYIYRLIAPATGSNNVVISLSSSAVVDYSFCSYTGCNQSSQPAAGNSISATSATSIAINSTKIAGSDWVFMYARNDVGNYSAGANTTLRNAASAIMACDSNGSNVRQLNLTSASGNHGAVGIPIAPAETYPMVRVFQFDQTNFEVAEWQVVLPENYGGGTVTAKIHWRTSAASGDVVWGVQAVAIGDNTAQATSYGQAQEVTDGANGAHKVNVTAATAAITLGGAPGPGKACWFRVYRNAVHASDTLAGDAGLQFVEISF